MGAKNSSVANADNLTRDQTRELIRAKIDRDGNDFNWHVWMVAASGFFTDSYNLFATNAILPALSYIYWPNDCSSNKNTIINILTLTGSVIGALVFGYLADKYGRTRLYGIELVIVIVSTLVIAAAGSGIAHQQSMFAWVASFRFFMGIGVGAEYPLSAVITTEWAPTKSRGRMMAAVFFMQPLGQFLAQLVGFLVLIGYNRSNDRILELMCFSNGTHPHPSALPITSSTCLIPNAIEHKLNEQCVGVVDQIWRWVAGVGAIPAVIAVVFRFSIGDPGLYDLDVQNEGGRALENTDKVYPSPRLEPEQGSIQLERLSHPNGVAQQGVLLREEPEHVAILADQEPAVGQVHQIAQPEEPLPEQFTVKGIREFFWDQGNWRYLAGTAVCWFMLDWVFYGIGIGNPRTLDQLWKANRPDGAVPITPPWLTDPTQLSYANLDQPTVSIYEILYQNARQSMLTVSTGSLAGNFLFIFLVNYIPRKLFLAMSFVWIGGLLIITGGVYLAAWDNSSHAATIVLIAFCFFFFSFGANTLTFIIPAEIFPTRYRCTCHGIAAAAGKIGAVISTAILPHIKLINDWNGNHLGYIFVIFGLIMLLATPFAWAWLPEVQNKRDERGGWKAPNKTLEDLGRGVNGAREDGQVIGFRDRLEPTLASIRIKMGIAPPKRRLASRRNTREGGS